jgi:hypothetical protein
MKTNIHLWSHLVQFFSEWKMFQTKFVKKIKTHFTFSNVSFLSKIVSFLRQCRKIQYSRTGHRWKYGACALHAGYLWLPTHTQNMWYSLLFHCNNGCTNEPQCYGVRTLAVLLLQQTNCVNAGWNTVAPLVLHLGEFDQLSSLSGSSVRIKEGGNPQVYVCDRIKMAYS